MYDRSRAAHDAYTELPEEEDAFEVGDAAEKAYNKL